MKSKNMIREPVVSGQFYPGTKEDLLMAIKELDPKEAAKISARGVVLPHAGYMCSGKVAVTTVSKIQPRPSVIILGPNHHGMGQDFALWGRGEWRTPLGKVQIDQDLAQKILKQDSYIQEDYLAHKFEHSIEVELPILQYFFGDFKFVPIACAMASLKEYRQVASQIYEAIKGIKEDVLLVASTDFTHYEPDSSARTKDRQAIESIIELNEEDLLGRVKDKNITMCGFGAVSVLLSCVKKLGARKAQVALYQTSGDTVGDYTSVVGYGGIIIS